MLISYVLNRTISQIQLINSNLIVGKCLFYNLYSFLAHNQYYSTMDGSKKDILEKYGSYSNYLIQKEVENRETKLKNETMSKYVRKLKMREINLLRAPILYEGPIYINYWMRKRRSGARK
ncbi:hypothetical protein MACK_003563 [Theileria orientalis]|uniref:Uncharacterized protein n=1 Tax=Theileria orientalis TaxID=68886 RepID=A0A976SJF3_THEOR|nr:hypothetical protein MACK_003563 [Theileria orientalis]